MSLGFRELLKFVLQVLSSYNNLYISQTKKKMVQVIFWVDMNANVSHDRFIV